MESSILDEETTTRLFDEPVPDAPQADSETPEPLNLPVKSRERYRFVRSIGFGGMKAVLLVHDRDTDRDMAMAIITDYRERPPHVMRRFVREAKLTAQLEHPNIVPVHDIGMDTGGAPFFTMKYLTGSSLAVILQRMARGDAASLERFSLDQLLLIYIRICNAAAFAHARGVVHLDLKPENINIGDYGEVLVLDWGLARYESDRSIESNCGTPGYMAPEQCMRDCHPDRRSDIYALGAILYTMLTFHHPLSGGSTSEVVEATRKGQIMAPSVHGNEHRVIPAALEAVALKAMSLRMEHRYQNVEELREEVMAFRMGFATEAEKASAFKKSALFLWRNKLMVLGLMVLLLLLMLFGIFGYAYHIGRLEF